MINHITIAAGFINGLSWILFSFCFYFPPVMATEYVFENLHSNIPIALSENDVILFANGRLRLDGHWLDGPANSTLFGVKEVTLTEGEQPRLSVVGQQTSSLDVVQAAQWLLAPGGIRAPQRDDWWKRRLAVPSDLPSQASMVNAHNVVLGQGQDEAEQTQLFYTTPDGNLNVPASSVGLDRVASEAKAINGQGDVVGVSIDGAGLRHSYVYRPAQGQGKRLRNGLSNSYQQSEALAINNQGQIAGQAQVSEEHWRAYRATADLMLDLGTLGGSTSVARSINEKGHVVGQAQDSEGNPRAFIYTETLQDLNSLVEVDEVLTDAIAINDHGSIIGTYLDSSESIQGFILRPVKPLIEQQPDNVFCLDFSKTDCSGNFSASRLALDGDWLALGQYDTVMLLNRVGVNWSYHSQIKMTSTDIRVDLHEQRLLIGAPNEDHSDLSRVGAIYIYDYDKTTDSWQLNQRLAPESAVQYLRFGDSVALHGQQLGVGHVDNRNTLTGFYYQEVETAWQGTSILPPTDMGLSYFGHQVQLNARWLVFGTCGSSCREVLIYEQTASDLTFHTLISEARVFEMALSQNTLAMGGSSIILYEHQDGQWQYQTRLVSPANDYRFGYEFALSHDTLVVASELRSPIRYYFNVYGRHEGVWRLYARRSVPFNPKVMALDGNVLVIGANDSSTPVQTYLVSQPSGADLQLTVVADQTDITISDRVKFDITVTNLSTLTESLIPLSVRFGLAVDYHEDGCHLPQSGCLKVTHISDFAQDVMTYRIDSVTTEQPFQFPLSLSFPAAGDYAIEFTFDPNLTGDDPNRENNQQIIRVNVRSDAPDLRIQRPAHDPSQCQVLAEEESLTVALDLANWPLAEDPEHKQAHVDWFLYQGESLMQSGHASSATFPLPALTPGDYHLQVQLIEANHVATNYQDRVSFCVQRPASQAPWLAINHPVAGSTLNLSGNDIRLDLTVRNWEMIPEGQRYRWSWDDLHSGENTALQLDLAGVLSAAALSNGEHQLQVQLLDTDGNVPLTREVSFSIFQPKDVTLAWQAWPESAVIQQAFDTSLVVVNNDIFSSVTDITVSITLPAGLTVISQPDRCSAAENDQLICTWDQLAALEKQTLNFSWQVSQPGEVVFTADMQQPEDPDMSNNQQSAQLLVIDPVDLAVTSTWDQQTVYVGQSLQAQVLVSNQSAEYTARGLQVSGTLPSQLQATLIPEVCQLDSESSQWLCQMAELAPSESQLLQWQFMAQTAGQFDIDLQVSNGQEELTPTDNQQSLTFSLQQPQLTILALPKAGQPLAPPEPVVLPFKIEQWLAEQTDQSLQWQLNEGPVQVMALSQAEGVFSLGGLAKGQYQLIVQLQQGHEPQPVGEKQIIDFTVERAPLQKVTETACLPADLHGTEQVLLKWCAPEKNYMVRYDDSPIELKPQVHISNWFTDDGHTRYRWWLDGEDQGIQQTLDPLSLSLTDGPHELRAQLLYTDDSESQISDTIQFRVLYPQIHFLEPATDQPLYLNRSVSSSRILLEYRIEDWQFEAEGVLHTIQVNDHEPIQRHEVSSLDVSELVAFQEENQVTIQLVDAAGHSINVSHTVSLAVREGSVVPRPEPETRASGGAMGIGWLLLVGLMGLWQYQGLKRVIYFENPPR